MCFSAIIVGVGFMAAFSLNLLPQPVYLFFYTSLAGTSPESQYPYLTKFEGRWQTTLTPLAAQTEIAQCEVSIGTLTIHDGQVTGRMSTLNRYITIVGVVDEEGVLRGKTRRGQGNEGSITGNIIKIKGEGDWTDSYDCRGTFSMKKIDLLMDPSRGSIVSYAGNVFLIRKGISQLPNPGKQLYVGDVIKVSANGSALVSIDFEPVSLTGGMTYTVSKARK